MQREPILSSSPVPLPARAGCAPGLTIREQTYRPGAAFARHDHSYASLFVMIGGFVRERAGRTAVECPPGAVGFIPAGAEHRSTFGETAARGLNVIMDEGWMRRCAAGAPAGPAYAQNALVSAAAFRLCCACRRPDATRTLAVEEAVVDLLSWTARAALPHGSGPGRWVRDVASLVREHSPEPITLGDVAAAVDRHPAHVCRAFRAAMGCSISTYVQGVRVEHACGLLRGPAALASVAQRSGFYDQPHFSRVFRRFIGVTPRQYRLCVA